MLAPEQSGFRSHLSTQDVLFKLIETTKLNFNKGHKTGAIFYDFEKTFDTTPHNLILKKLHLLKCPSTLAKWLQSYLTNRSFQIKLDSQTHSSTRPVKAGIPQGGCISAFLFAIFINGVGTKLRKLGVNSALFADYISVWFNSKNLKKIAKKLQKATYILQSYATK